MLCNENDQFHSLGLWPVWMQLTVVKKCTKRLKKSVFLSRKVGTDKHNPTDTVFII